MSDYIVCEHPFTISAILHREFGDTLPMPVYKCIECNNYYVKNLKLPNYPVASIHSITAKAWLAEAYAKYQPQVKA